MKKPFLSLRKADYIAMSTVALCAMLILSLLYHNSKSEEALFVVVDTQIIASK